MAKTASQNTAVDSEKFDNAEQLQILETMILELSPELVHTYGNAVTFKEHFVLVLRARQCRKCGTLHTLENVNQDDVCGKCQ